MLRRVLWAALVLAAARAVEAQDLSTLTIKIVLDNAGQQTPVARHRLLVSDNPPTAAPRLVTTGPDGTATVRLQPGRYIVESDRAVALNGKAYEWIQVVDVAAGRDATLALTEANAETRSADPSPAGASGAGGASADAAPLVENDPAFLLPRWQDSVVVIWTELARGTGFLIDGKGLVVAPQRLIGTALSVEVQLTPTTKVAANVVGSDKARDVAVLRIDPSTVSSMRPIPLTCGQPESARLVDGQDIFALGIAYRQSADMMPGTISRLDPRRLGSTITLGLGSAGGPVFAADGRLVGMTVTAENEDARNARAQVVRAPEICDALAAADARLGQAPLPAATHLPVDPAPVVPTEALKAAVSGRAGSLNPYQTSTSSFDVAFITPLMLYGVQYQVDQIQRRSGRGASDSSRREPTMVPPILFFHNWSEYVSDLPPVLLVRVTPKLTEGFWATVARGAAYTQGMSLPSMKRAAAGFARMKAFCGGTEVVPIHPFKIEQRVSETEAIAEGLYVFAADAFGPQCADARLEIYSEKAPQKPEPRPIDATILEQIWRDFAPYRAPVPAATGVR